MFGGGLMCFIAWSSLTPLMVQVVTVKHSDLLLHLLAYSVSTFWFAQIFRGRRNRIKIAVAMIAYGLLMEAGQGLLTLNRDASILDAIANACGVGLGILASLPFAPAGLLFQFEKLVSPLGS